MCTNEHSGKFTGFEDLHDHSFDHAHDAPELTDAERDAQATLGTHRVVHEERCSHCRGTGRFRSFSGRDLGDCFKCKGTGKLTFKTSAPQRERAREQKHQAAAQRELAKVAQIDAWIAANPERFTWMTEAKRRGFDFAQSLVDALGKYGSLTPGQLAAIDKCMARDAERAAARVAQHQEVTPTSTPDDALDLRSLPSGYYAVPDGDTRLKLRVNNVRNADSRWYGWVFVDDGAEYGHQQKYGSQKPGQPYRGKCVEQLRAILADPRAASAAYGRLVGRCGVCGRKLEDADSVAAGIGPVCAGKFND
jgi:hypothetical protein